MKAIVCTRYGRPEVLQPRDLEEPTPRRGEVRIRVRATAVTSSDCIVRSLSVPPSLRIPARVVLGITRPRQPVIGMVVSGEIEALGPGATTFKEGDRVFGFDRFGFGAYAEYKCMPEGGVLASAPAGLSHEDAAAIPYGGLLALWFLSRANVRARQKVLVYGASGAVGTSAVQLAKHLGAEVTAVCGATNLELVRSLGADAVIDYTRDDFTRRSERYDLVLVAVGNRVHPPSRADCRDVLAPGGSYIAVDQGRPKHSARDLLQLKELAEAGALRPVVDRSYPLERIVEAHRYVDGGHKKGNVVITVA